MCKSYVCKICFVDYCPECELTILCDDMYPFYKYLASKIKRLRSYEVSEFDIKEMIHYVDICEPEIFETKMTFESGILHNKKIFKWEFQNPKYSFCKNDCLLCPICSENYCFSKCPHTSIHSFITQ